MGLVVALVGVVDLSVPQSASAVTSTFVPVADTFVQSDTPSSSYGSTGQLNVDGSPVRRAFVRFSVSGVSGTVTGAKLRLHVDDIANGGSPAGGSARAMSNLSWSETSTTWNNQPAIDGVALG